MVTLRWFRTESCAWGTFFWMAERYLEQVILVRTWEMRRSHSDIFSMVAIFIAMVTTSLSIPLQCYIIILTGQCEWVYEHTNVLFETCSCWSPPRTGMFLREGPSCFCSWLCSCRAKHTVGPQPLLSEWTWTHHTPGRGITSVLSWPAAVVCRGSRRCQFICQVLTCLSIKSS